MNRNYVLTWLASSIAAAAFVTSASAQFPTAEVPKSEPEYIAKAKTAAPASIVDKATIIMMQAGPFSADHEFPSMNSRSRLRALA